MCLQRHLRCDGSLVIVLLQIFGWFWQWNNFENRLIFGKVKAYKNGANYLGHPVYKAANVKTVRRMPKDPQNVLFRQKYVVIIQIFALVQYNTTQWKFHGRRQEFLYRWVQKSRGSGWPWGLTKSLDVHDYHKCQTSKLAESETNEPRPPLPLLQIHQQTRYCT